MGHTTSNAEPSLCAGGCGFYGSPENHNLCSKCYRDYLKEAISKESSTKAKPQDTSPTRTATEETTENPETAASEKITETKLKQRCESCNKKVGLLGFSCRCGHVYCGDHRYPEKHSCPSDYKTAARQLLVKENPLMKADKIDYKA